MTKITTMIVMNLVTHKAAAECELLFNKPALGLNQGQVFNCASVCSHLLCSVAKLANLGLDDLAQTTFRLCPVSFMDPGQ